MSLDWSACVSHLRAGHSLGYPTDTVWGLGCVAADADVFRRTIALKGDKRSPVCSVLLASVDWMPDFCEWDAVPEKIQTIIRATLPGPFTFVLPAKKGVCEHLQGTDGTLGLRCVDKPEGMGSDCDAWINRKV
eukprot:gene12149-biopygen4745